MSFKGRHSFGMSSSRKPWGRDDKVKHGKHSAALIESRNNLTGGGALLSREALQQGTLVAIMQEKLVQY